MCKLCNYGIVTTQGGGSGLHVCDGLGNLGETVIAVSISQRHI